MDEENLTIELSMLSQTSDLTIGFSTCTNVGRGNKQYDSYQHQ